MDEETIRAVVEELTRALEGRAMGKVFQLGRASLAIDFRTGDGRYLLLAAEPNRPRLYLMSRSVRELEKQSLAPASFALVLRKHLSGARLESIDKDAGERIVRFRFEAHDAAGEARPVSLVAQLTGRSSNLFLLDGAERIIDTLRPSRGDGQEMGARYLAPQSLASAEEDSVSEPDPSPSKSPAPLKDFLARGAKASISEALDEHYRRMESAQAFAARASARRAELRRAMEKLRKLEKNLRQDLAAHGDADAHKRVGDLLLANIANAERRGSVVRLTDYYAEGAPIIELEVDENRSLQDEASRRFARYTKARRAAQEIAERLEGIQRELAALEARRAALERIVETEDETALENFGERGGKGRGDASEKRAERSGRGGPTPKAPESIPGVRRYRSSDGYEILVGRGARDNEHLTFRVARSHDWWLHAADYPGSHVVVRNLKRGAEVPHRTIIEAAQLAAHFSQAKKDSKVAVHYTERKFVSKMRGAAPGLVRLSSFRTLLVEPGERVERI